MASGVPALTSLVTWVGRWPHHVWGLTFCALALLPAIATVDDWGVMGDTVYALRPNAASILQYLEDGDDDALVERFAYAPDRYYSGVFVVPLLALEGFLGLDDSRNAHIFRHLATHLVFLAGGFAGYLLAFRMFRSRWLALFALALYLLHPRIYAHSFFNPKDVPFLAFFMISLWLAHRTFDTCRVGAFALCGVAVGLLTSLRVMGLALVAVLVVAWAANLWRVRTWSQRRRILAAGGLFAFAAAGAFVASIPYLWADPIGRFVEMVDVLAQFPNEAPQRFQGKTVLSTELPPQYLPVWFGITTPPLALLLGAVGIAGLIWRTVTRRDALLGNTPLRFELMIAACIALPSLVVVVLGSTLYNGWRHMYFLWAPFVLLAVSGLSVLAKAAQRLPLPAGWWPALSGGRTVYFLAAFGLGTVVVQVARLHPHLPFYFNELVSRAASEDLRQQYSMYHMGTLLSGYAYILEENPDGAINMQRGVAQKPTDGLAGAAPRHLEMFPLRERRRVTFDKAVDPDFYVVRQNSTLNEHLPPILYRLKVYDSTVVRVATPNLSRVHEAEAAVHRAAFRRITAGNPVAMEGAAASGFEIYLGETDVALVKQACAPHDLHRVKRLTIYPRGTGRFLAHGRHLPGATKRIYGVRVGESCLWRAELPEVAIAQLHFHDILRFNLEGYLDDMRRSYAALAATTPAARSTFDLFLEDGTLIYVKESCTQADAEAPFFLHVVPADPDDLGPMRRRHGFDNMDFQWSGTLAATFDGVCLLARKLPDYAIASIVTGQFLVDEPLWRVELTADS